MITRMDLDGKWTLAGELNQYNMGQNVIYDGEYLIVIGGGAGTRQTEKCSILDGLVSCTSQAPELENYFRYPELFLVPNDFCKK